MSDHPRLKTFADDNINVIKKQKFSFGTVENVEKEKMLVSSIFSYFLNFLLEFFFFFSALFQVGIVW